MNKVMKKMVILVAAGAALTGCVEDQAYVSDYYSSHSYYGDGYSSGPAPARANDRHYSPDSGYYSNQTPPGADGYAGSQPPQPQSGYSGGQQSGYSSGQTSSQPQSGYSSSQTPSQGGYNSSGTATGSSGYSSGGAATSGATVAPAKPAQPKNGASQPSSGVIAVPVLPKRTINENEDRAAARGGASQDGGYSTSN